MRVLVIGNSHIDAISLLIDYATLEMRLVSRYADMQEPDIKLLVKLVERNKIPDIPRKIKNWQHKGFWER